LQGTNGKILYSVGLLTALLTAFYMFRLWYMAFMGESRSPRDVHPHESPWSMRGPLVILPLSRSAAAGSAWSASALSWRLPSRRTGREASSWRLAIPFTGTLFLETVLSRGCFCGAGRLADRRQILPAQACASGAMAAALPAGYKLLANKYFVDEFYGATVVKPLLGFSKYILEWVVDVGILGGAAWLLGGIATFAGAILQRWQSGNLRSYAAWLAAGAAAVLLFLLVPWATVLASLTAIHLGMAGH
jgi:NADH-quinone oxidoreductase subunit L